MQTIQLLKNPISFFDVKVHASLRGDGLLAARHRAFISSHFLGGMLAILVFLLYLLLARSVTPGTAAAFIWLVSPMGIAIFLARTGRLEAAHLASIVNLTALIVYVAALSGGLSSFVLAWLVVVPVEAALANSRRLIYLAITLAVGAVAGLWLVQWLGVLPAPGAVAYPPVFIAICTSAAVFYVGALSMNVYALAKRTETAARAGRQRYRLMAENATDMISVHDSQGNASFVSLGSRRLCHQIPSALMNDGFLNALRVGDRPAFLAAVEEAVSGDVEAGAEFRMRCSGARRGKYIWVEFRCRPLKTQSPGESGQVVAVTRDISERKEKEVELTRMRDAAEAANRAKSRFLANISHELRTPLNAIIGFSDILSVRVKDAGPDNLEYIQLINESGHHLLQVVNDLLDMSKIEAGGYEIVREKFVLSKLMDECVAVVGPSAQGANVSVEIDIPDDIGEMNADRRAIKQIVFNLLSNAVKFSHDGGRVVIGARAHDDTFEIFAADQGIGISRDDLENLGRPFVQAQSNYNRDYEGTGLGLSVTSGFAALHGGHMQIQSTLGEGTRVRVFIPQQAAARAGDDQVDEPHRPIRVAS